MAAGLPYTNCQRGVFSSPPPLSSSRAPRSRLTTQMMMICHFQSFFLARGRQSRAVNCVTLNSPPEIFFIGGEGEGNLLASTRDTAYFEFHPLSNFDPPCVWLTISVYIYMCKFIDGAKVYQWTRKMRRSIINDSMKPASIIRSIIRFCNRFAPRWTWITWVFCFFLSAIER